MDSEKYLESRWWVEDEARGTWSHRSFNEGRSLHPDHAKLIQLWDDAEHLSAATARVTELEAALARAGDGWRDISTAPKTGEAILAYPMGIFGSLQANVVYWDRDESYQSWRDLDGERAEGLTHWMPLPTPPVAAPGDGGE